jgi:hypothetical protein
MFLIVAGKQDEGALSLAARWASYGAELLTPEDLSICGWRHHSHATQADIAVINRRAVATREISGVLTRLPCVSEQELMHIVPNDRAYVASEMTAFLLSWLATLNCPLLNRPTPTCLSGPGWRTEQWVHLAARLGIPVSPVCRHARLHEDISTGIAQHPHDTLTVVGNRCIGVCDGMRAVHARRLATAAGVDLLAAHFTSVEGAPRLLRADLWPDVTSADVADAILEYFRGGSTC